MDAYDMIFKRKSVRRFDKALKLTEEELAAIGEKLKTLVPYNGDIRTAFRIVPSSETGCGRGEYCLLAYSEAKGDYLLNTGFMLEQMDIYFASVNIGACWHGFSKPDMPVYDGLDFVILIAFGKAEEKDFRRDYKKASRKDTETVWQGDYFKNVAETVKYSPSACNSQPWRVKCTANKIELCRAASVFSLFSKAKMAYFNNIDMGIFSYILELCLEHEGLEFERGGIPEAAEGLIPIASYTIKQQAEQIQ
ncbi:MAG: nitroreductase family protein [Eubacteriales bacterium]|nr:nitroreductase family protein [Eubacteriales bacterium]